MEEHDGTDREVVLFEKPPGEGLCWKILDALSWVRRWDLGEKNYITEGYFAKKNTPQRDRKIIKLYSKKWENLNARPV